MSASGDYLNAYDHPAPQHTWGSRSSRPPSQGSGPPASPGSPPEPGRGAVVVQDGPQKPVRAQWGGQLEFILTLVGYAVGLGNVWRFPYLCYKNGGGAFLVPYFIMLLLVGLPLFYLEVHFGQFASLGPITIWRASPLLKGIGYASVITDLFIALSYNVIICWTIYYFFASMASPLPWVSCGNSWNTEICTTFDMFRNYTSNNLTSVTLGNTTYLREELKTPSEEYFFNKVLQMSTGVEEFGDIIWPLAVCLLVAWVVVYLVLIKGISSLGKVVYFSSIFPYVLLTILMIRGVTLDGAMDGIIFYLKPDFSRLMDVEVWSEAATQIFYSLSACSGGLIAMSSYNKFGNNCKRDSLLVPLINCLTSFYSGFVIFSVLGFMAKQKGVSVADVAASGPGLAFVVYPEGITQMPLPTLWAVLFFFMMMTLGFSSQFSMTECFFSAVIDEWPDLLRKTKLRGYIFRGVCILIFFIIGLSMVTDGGFYLFNILDTYTASFPLLVVGLCELLALMYVYGYSNFARDVEMMLGAPPNIYFKVTLRFIAPLVLLAVIMLLGLQWSDPTLNGGAYVYPVWANGVGWGIVCLCVVSIPLVYVITACRMGGYKFIKSICVPLPSWGPADPSDRIKDRYNRYLSSNKLDKENNETSHPVSGHSVYAIPRPTLHRYTEDLKPERATRHNYDNVAYQPDSMHRYTEDPKPENVARHDYDNMAYQPDNIQV